LKKLLILIPVLVADCNSEVSIGGEKYMIADNPFSWGKGLSEYDKKPKGIYRGMIFVFPKEKTYTFHTKGFKHYLLLCNFENKTKKNCLCLAPGSYAEVKGRVFLEELYKDKECKRVVYF